MTRSSDKRKIHPLVFTKSGNFDEEVVGTFECQILADWKRHGLRRLSVATATQLEFHRQDLPEAIKTTCKMRKGPVRRMSATAPSMVAAFDVWPEDDMWSAPYPVLIYVRSGVADIHIADYLVHCPQGHFLALPPNVPRPFGKTSHLQEPSEDKSCEIWWFFAPGAAEHVALNVCYSSGKEHAQSGHYYLVEEAQVIRYFFQAFQEIQEPHRSCQESVWATVEMFFRQFLQGLKNNAFYNRGAPQNQPLPVPKAASAIATAQNYIDKNLNHPLTIGLVAQAVYLSPATLTRRFRHETGQTFHQYLTLRRLEEAKHWLTRSQCSIEVVSHFVGLRHSQFHSLFRKHFGMTPAKYRLAARAQNERMSEF